MAGGSETRSSYRVEDQSRLRLDWSGLALLGTGLAQPGLAWPDTGLASAMPDLGQASTDLGLGHTGLGLNQYLVLLQLRPSRDRVETRPKLSESETGSRTRTRLDLVLGLRPSDSVNP